MAEDNKFIEDDLAILAEFVDESEADLNATDKLFVELESRPGDLDLINAIFRPLHSIKGNSAFLGLMQVRRLSHEMENLLDDLRKQRCAPFPDLVSLLLAGVDEIKAILERIRKREDEVADKTKFGELLVSLQRMRPDGTAATPAPTATPAKPPTQAPAQAKPAAAAAPTATTAHPAQAANPAAAIERTIRIPEKHLDKFDKIQAQLAALSKKLASATGNAVQALPEAADILARTASEMGRQLQELRSVPASDLLQRAPRIARETAAAIGKKARVALSGETIRIPRSLASVLETPLMHMVRNAVDHGLEIPALRRKAGKPEEGIIRVEIREDKGSVLLIVADDGPGIDFKTLLTKALTKGLVPRDGKITPEQIMNLIFLPGISSAKQVTDISGRGVGMDVVKKMVEEAGGKIQVHSKAGEGTQFVISLSRS